MNTTKKAKGSGIKTSYVNVNRAKSSYRDKYKRDVEKAIAEFAGKIGKQSGEDFTQPEWKKFFKTILIPLDKESERRMIELFRDNRDELNSLLILHNTLASNNIAEVAFKKYEKESPNRWHDLEDFKQMALEGLAIAAQRFDPDKYDNKFITFATWWMLNRVLKAKQDEPHRKNGSIIGHTSLDSTVGKDSDSETTFEEVLTPDMIACGYAGLESINSNPIDKMEQETSEENYDFFQDIKQMTNKKLDGIDVDKAKTMTKYLLSIVEREGDSYEAKNIYLYVFRKIFNKCSEMFGSDEIYSKKLSSYVSEAPKSKNELLSRLNISEDQYKTKCKKLLGKTYTGI